MPLNLSAFQKHFHQNQDFSAYEALATWLSPLAEVDGDLPQRILQYIFSGENPEILQEVVQQTKIVENFAVFDDRPFARSDVFATHLDKRGLANLFVGTPDYAPFGQPFGLVGSR